MHGHQTADESQAIRSLDELVFALCHEIGNLLAAARLEAGLLDHAAGPEALGRASERLSGIAARSGSLLALVRALLLPAESSLRATPPRDLLAGLRSGLDASCDDRVAIDLASSTALAAVDLSGEVLHHLLLTAIFFGLEARDPGQAPVRVGAGASEQGVEFFVEDDAPREEEPAALRGRALALAVARRLLASWGARVEVSHPAGHTRVAFVFPGTRD